MGILRLQRHIILILILRLLQDAKISDDRASLISILCPLRVETPVSDGILLVLEMSKDFLPQLASLGLFVNILTSGDV